MAMPATVIRLVALVLSSFSSVILLMARRATFSQSTSILETMSTVMAVAFLASSPSSLISLVDATALGADFCPFFLPAPGLCPPRGIVDSSLIQD